MHVKYRTFCMEIAQNPHAYIIAVIIKLLTAIATVNYLPKQQHIYSILCLEHEKASRLEFERGRVLVGILVALEHPLSHCDRLFYVRNHLKVKVRVRVRVKVRAQQMNDSNCTVSLYEIRLF